MLDPLLGFCRLRSHGRRRRLHLRQERSDHLRLEHELEVAQASEEGRYKDPNNTKDDDALGHLGSCRQSAAGPSLCVSSLSPSAPVSP